MNIFMRSPGVRPESIPRYPEPEDEPDETFYTREIEVDADMYWSDPEAISEAMEGFYYDAKYTRHEHAFRALASGDDIAFAKAARRVIAEYFVKTALRMHDFSNPEDYGDYQYLVRYYEQWATKFTEEQRG